MKYTVRVEWKAVAFVDVEAHDADEAVDKVWDEELPWAQAQEAEDGGCTSFSVVNDGEEVGL